MIPVLPSGSVKLDRLTGIGGYPLGYVTEVYGPAQSAKSSLALSFIRKNQREHIAALVDAEYKFDPIYADDMGVDPHSLIVFQCSKMGHVVDFITAMFKESVSIIILDSIASVDATTKELWLLLSQLSDGIPPETAVIWLNQVRTRIPYGEKVSYGRKAARFYPALRVKLENPTAISTGRKKIGLNVTCSIPKNVFFENQQPSQDLEIFYEKGTWEALEVIDLGVDCGLLERRGQWYYYRDRCLGNGRYPAAERIQALPIYESLIQTLRERMKL